ncbi:MAG: SDR family NAD(P)-dependent oxidoreductase, partial [Candidatus Aminicenantes bacterium]
MPEDRPAADDRRGRTGGIGAGLRGGCRRGAGMNKELFDLKGKVAVITGGGGALGGAMAKALAESGAPVALLDVRESAAVNAARRIAAAGHRAIGVPGDVLDERSLADAAARVLGEFGRVDILVNAAGGNSPAA